MHGKGPPRMLLDAMLQHLKVLKQNIKKKRALRPVDQALPTFGAGGPGQLRDDFIYWYDRCYKGAAPAPNPRLNSDACRDVESAFGLPQLEERGNRSSWCGWPTSATDAAADTWSHVAGLHGDVRCTDARSVRAEHPVPGAAARQALGQLLSPHWCNAALGAHRTSPMAAWRGCRTCCSARIASCAFAGHGPEHPDIQWRTDVPDPRTAPPIDVNGIPAIDTMRAATARPPCA